MKPFNLIEAKQGKPICTKKGNPARIICADLKNTIYTVVAAVYDFNTKNEDVVTYTSEGKFDKGLKCAFDLYMVEDEKPKCPFKPFDKVLVRDNDNDNWLPDFFRNQDGIGGRFTVMCGFYYNQCIPYNEETEHLIDTTDEAPEKYIIWQHV